MQAIQRIRFTIVPIVLVALLLIGCQGRQPQYRVGVSQCLDDAWRQTMNEEMARELLFHPDITLETRIAHGSNELQCAQIDSFIAEQIDLLVVSPNVAVAVQPAVSRAYRAGIPVIVADRRVEGDEWTAFIGGDNLQVGHLLGERLCQIAREQGRTIHVFEIVGLPGSTPASLRHTGMLEAIQNVSNVRYEGYAVGDWFEEPARRVTDSVLRAHKDIDIIVAQNDLMARGASTAANALARNIHILGVDAMPGTHGGLQAIMDGIIDASATYASRGDLIIQCAAQILHGEPHVRDTVLQTDLVDIESAGAMLQAFHRIDHEISAIKMLQDRIVLMDNEYRMQRVLTYLMSALSLLLILFCCVVIYIWRYRQKVAKERMEKEAMLSRQAEQLQAITEELARTKAAKGEEEKFMQRLQTAIENKLSDPNLDIVNLSGELGVSRSSLYRKIKSVTGSSPVELIRHIRLEKARKLLRETDLTIQQITYDVGFSAPSYFTKCYRQHFGIAPTEEPRRKK